MSAALLKFVAIALGAFLGMRAAEALEARRERKRQTFPRPSRPEFLRAYQEELGRILEASGVESDGRKP